MRVLLGTLIIFLSVIKSGVTLSIHKPNSAQVLDIDRPHFRDLSHKTLGASFGSCNVSSDCFQYPYYICKNSLCYHKDVFPS